MGLVREGDMFSPGIKHRLNEQDLQAWKQYLEEQTTAKPIEPNQEVLGDGENPPQSTPAEGEA
ncbi:MAG: hypothetical protein UY16_C0008G0026 [Candidatus Gottesmanbacteria bacterium GW2011_GWA2_47_9]|uniref:Uncharacterized protein n=2 Tax=Microgenomates group TaxID=1794810 RepID=A0A0G0UTG5_9BACT|nr:MAG: hypothetical protein UU42_C0005G0012 [Candidatus Woesebacteria bacterium GW2011_GWA1_41_13b]KKU88379.1 MAG: hypothetical protein UY16_C0008G0026 [Candidatus Gottesmanbacteria bacterium GW2011_GWA2_47_9]